MSQDSSPPPYLRVAERLRQRIQSGDLAPGDLLPSLSEIKEETGYSGTVGQRAYAVLVDEGLVVARPGRGHFVRSQEERPLLVRRPRVAAGSGSPTEALLTAQGVRASWDSESTTARADARIAERLGIAPGDPVMHTAYVYRADGEPVQLADSWEPMAVTGGTLVVLPEAGPYAGIGVADRMALIGIEVGTPVERVTARGASRAEAALLGSTPAAPVLAVERTYYDQAAGRAVETADIVLLGSRWAAEYGTRPTTADGPTGTQG
ncbi:GntR family transcriptional regulator [Kitasatospora sp. DSM 101779]|uniref:GntR family transcriptional regulator n=1 Tax=Kitasatospora sp. DSM 101779 TaxID=2853165 RepID=UPI0021D8616F|nr:GntR family transcriptional regulator [Kitasatospora sp. DSM 101779]MCU7825466.1 GntR family transcriptional regulator [Kitasatospora sp. DSM 101779]